MVYKSENILPTVWIAGRPMSLPTDFDGVDEEAIFISPCMSLCVSERPNILRMAIILLSEIFSDNCIISSFDGMQPCFLSWSREV